MSHPLASLSLLLSFFLCASAAAQLEGHFSLSKTSYSAGEPIFLVFEVENTGSQPILIKTANPLSFCGGYKIEVGEPRLRNHLAVTVASSAAAQAAVKSYVQASGTLIGS
jgi:hypothetical protein